MSPNPRGRKLHPHYILVMTRNDSGDEICWANEDSFGSLRSAMKEVRKQLNEFLDAHYVDRKSVKWNKKPSEEPSVDIVMPINNGIDGKPDCLIAKWKVIKV